ncbi:pyridoxamine 5'-phosphate oxidase [Szabonella alba]|uniref:Pyridoxine/pyridoxamine 5'-phosphate oxidase n=1 Tax=Szabonella alba TaxID=2804194 RepID=A0A8K0VCN7_9RHOB|nr:pyridoxamine 5'-phosphate oxidase [Szabonella alba]MBL4917309.1 pyridoxamine 5'-phosphate oxidase [Szabonella alba]
MDRTGIFAGQDPFAIAKAWLADAGRTEPNDPNAIALATVDEDGLPDVRMVLLKEIEAGGFVFYTNFRSRKGQQIEASGKAAFVMHWKSLRRQIRVRGRTEKVEDAMSDAYFQSRALDSRLGAWASRQSEPLASRTALMAEAARMAAVHGMNPERPLNWGGIRIIPDEIEFWADGAFRLHDRFRWTRTISEFGWSVVRLNP